MKPSEATTAIRGRCTPDLTLYWTDHAKDRMAERELIMGDILHVLKHGFVHDEAQSASRAAWKYAIQCVTPNSGGRTVKLIVIPCSDGGIKIVTVMWADER